SDWVSTSAAAGPLGPQPLRLDETRDPSVGVHPGPCSPSPLATTACIVARAAGAKTDSAERALLSRRLEELFNQRGDRVRQRERECIADDSVAYEVVGGPSKAGPQRPVNRLPGPADPVRARRRHKGEDQFLARGVKLAGRTVEGRSREPLDHAVEAAFGRSRRGGAWIGQSWLTEGARPERELDGDQAHHRRRERREHQSTLPRRHPTPLRRARRIGPSASAASNAQSASARRKLRVSASCSAPTTESRVWRRRMSFAAPRLLNGSARSGTVPLGAWATTVRRSSTIGTSCWIGISAFKSALVPPSRASRLPCCRSWERTGATNTSASTRPRCRAPIVTVPSCTSPWSGATARRVRTGTAKPIPVPHRASAKMTITTLVAGRDRE